MLFSSVLSFMQNIFHDESLIGVYISTNLLLLVEVCG